MVYVNKQSNIIDHYTASVNLTLSSPFTVLCTALLDVNCQTIHSENEYTQKKDFDLKSSETRQHCWEKLCVNQSLPCNH